MWKIGIFILKNVFADDMIFWIKFDVIFMFLSTDVYRSFVCPT